MTARVICKGKILLKFTFSKLSNVLDMLYLCRNLIFGIRLNKVGLKNVIEVNKIIISRNAVFVEKGYLNGSLSVLNLASEVLMKILSVLLILMSLLICGMVGQALLALHP